MSSVFSLPPDAHTPEKVKEEEILDPKQRQVYFLSLGSSYILTQFLFLNFIIVSRPVKSVQALYTDTLAALQELLKSVLARDPTPDGLQSVFKVKNL